MLSRMGLANLWRRKMPLPGVCADAGMVHAAISKTVKFFLLAVNDI
jgi:hypothetical protein